MATASGVSPGASTPPLIAMGIVSAPEYLERRAACRTSWMRWPNIGKAFHVYFVVRARGAPSSVSELLRLEHEAHGDVLRVDVPWNETRLRGPVLSVAAWFAYATRQLSPSPRFVAKLDDDAYLYAPALETLVREALRVAPTPERIYLGPMSWFHWYPKIFERSGFGWSYTMAWMMGQHCRNATTAEERCRHAGCGPCVGPFPFASGYFALLSTPLAAELLAADSTNEVRDDDVNRLRQVTSLPTRTGGVQVKVMEDIWLGSLLYRSHVARGPVTYVALSEKDDKTLVSDGWGLKVTKSAVIVHVKNHQKGKQLERFLAVDDFLKAKRCTQELAVTCTVGCRGFLNDGEVKNIANSPTYSQVWAGRVDNESFCSGVQAGAAYCRVGGTGARKCPRKPVDLLTKEHAVLFRGVAERAAEQMAMTTRMTIAAQGVLTQRAAILEAETARFRVQENRNERRGD